MTDDKPWLTSYPPGIAAEIDPSVYSSLLPMLDESLQKYGERDGYLCMGARMTYREMDQRAKQVAAWLQGTGLPRGSRIAVMLPNVLQYPVLITAILRAGMTVVNVNPQYTPRELEHQLKDSGAKAIFILENFASTLAKVLSNTALEHVVVTAVGDLMGLKGKVVNLVLRHIKKAVPAWDMPQALSLKAVFAAGAQRVFAPVVLAHSDLAFLQYTGGTTGVAKGAMLSHGNLVANVLQCEAWLTGGLDTSENNQLVFLNALPLYHIFALTVCGLMGMRLGVLSLLIPNPRDIPDLVKQIKRTPVNVLPAVNTLFNAMLADPVFRTLDHSGLQLCMSGGMALHKTVAELWFATTGVHLVEGYGLSETSPVATANPCTVQAFNGSIGLPVPSTEVKIVADNGQACATGENGELAIRGPQVMSGYWNRPEDTAAAFTPDHFFLTGDIANIDQEGFVRIVDRKKDMILVSGFNVYPNEVEGVLAAMPGVKECACIGVPDERAGEAVKVFIVKRDPALTTEQVKEHCREQLTAYKRPRQIEFVEQLPKTNVGKILRRQLREASIKSATEAAAASSADPS